MNNKDEENLIERRCKHCTSLLALDNDGDYCGLVCEAEAREVLSGAAEAKLWRALQDLGLA